MRSLPRENLHVTLRFLGDADVDEVIGSSRRPDAAGERRRCSARRSICAPSGRSSCPSPASTSSRSVVERAVRGVGTANERRRFVGHLTLARLGKKARPDRSVGRLFEASFEVGEIALVASTLTERGSIYETVETWPTR